MEGVNEILKTSEEVGKTTERKMQEKLKKHNKIEKHSEER